MPSEFRHILFQKVEVARALRDYRKLTNTTWPSGRMVDAQLVSEQAGAVVKFTLRLSEEPENPSAGWEEVTAGGAELAAALILFCRSRHIPLPSKGSKALQLFGEQLGLVISHNPKGDGHVPKV